LLALSTGRQFADVMVRLMETSAVLTPLVLISSIKENARLRIMK
jgi:hypothetical protein